MTVSLISALMAGETSAQIISLPNVIGETEDDARGTLAEAGIVGKIHTDFGDGADCARRDVEEGHVCNQSPSAGKEQAAFLDVWLVLQDRRPPGQTVTPEDVPEVQMPPNLAYGATEEEAVAEVVEAGFIGSIEVLVANNNECSNNRGEFEGHVCATVPGGRRRVPADTDVFIYLQPKRTHESAYGLLPNVLGMPIAKAIDALLGEKFESFSLEIIDDVQCDAGVVCRWSSNGEPHLRRGQLWLKAGTEYPGRTEGESYRMPDLRGDSLALAIEKIDAQGPKASIGTDLSRGICGREEKAGIEPRSICRQTPAAGQSTSGRRLRVVLAEDPEPSKTAGTAVTMPDLVGMSRADAVATLEAAGLSNIRVKEKAGPGCQTDKICGTSPAAGKKAYPQVVQTLYVGGMNTTTD